MAKKRKWEEEYEKYKNGEMNKKIEELNEKINNKTATKDDYETQKKIQKISANIYKVTNILELKEKLVKQEKEIKQEIYRRSNLKKANIEAQKIEEEFQTIDSEKDKVFTELKLLNKSKSSKEEKEKEEGLLRQKLNELDSKLSENNKRYRDNQEEFTNNGQNQINKFHAIQDKDLEDKCFEIGTKVSKCNMAASNLMKGASWDAIEIKLDNWKDRNFTSKDKLSKKVKSEFSMEDLSEKVIQTTDKQIDNESENALAEQSEFEKKHPKLAKVFNFFKNTFGKNKTINTVNKEKIENTREEKITTNTNDSEFKAYLKEVAEKGMEEVKKDKLEKAKQQAYNRETKKFGKEYAEKSYQTDDKTR